MAGFFKQQQGRISLAALEHPNTGFRPGQLGALHSVISHFSVYDDPAIASLPTGYGKTAVIMALPFVLGASRLLVVEPSDVLRRQTASQFAVLSTLRKLNVLHGDVPNPTVRGQKGRPTAEEWDAMAACDVVVSTPASTSPTVEPKAPPQLFDVIIFDEAHHAPADTWKAYLEHHSHAKFVFLTATPFRRDKKAIPGRIAYSYPVSRASREKAFGRVSFRAAPVRNDHDEDEVDRAIAREAVRQLAADREAGYDHRMLVRAASLRTAQDLLTVYRTEGARVEAIDSHLSKRRQDQIEAQLVAGELDGIVCVDMFGEGYDFPKLKVAALHAPHRSLVPTLQFIGRFARTNGERTGDATLIAPASRLRDATAKLFQEGVDIAQLIDEAAQAQIRDGEGDREILEILKTRVQAESDYDAVSPMSLKLYAHARIFECTTAPDFRNFGAIIGRRLKLAKQWMSEDGRISLLLTVDTEPPNWATSDVLVNVRHDAFLLAYNDTTRLCYIGSTRRTDKLYLDLMQASCRDQHRPISFERTRKALAGLGDLRFYNVGLKNTAFNTQAESYRTLTGPRAERAVTAGDARAFVQGHFFGSGVDGGDRETIGASSSSRIWSNQRLAVSDYLDWITKLNGRLAGDIAVASSQLDIVQPTRTLRALPALVIGGSWPKDAYRQAPRVRYRRGGGSWIFRQVTDLELSNFVVSGNEMRFDIGDDQVAIPFMFTITGGQIIRSRGQGWELQIQAHQDDWEDVAGWLSMHPPAFFAADKSSFQGMNVMPAPPLQASRLKEQDVEVVDWDGCDIRREFGPPGVGGLVSVHEHLRARLVGNAAVEIVVYDHRSGEAADFIVVGESDEGMVRISLYHCKGAGGAPSGGRVADVYEVTCQLLKSVAYCEVELLVKHVEHRTNPGRHQVPSTFIKGTAERFRELVLDTAPDMIEFVIYGVQPGISNAQMDEHLVDLMAFSLDYVQRGGAARGGWIVHA